MAKNPGSSLAMSENIGTEIIRLVFKSKDKKVIDRSQKAQLEHEILVGLPNTLSNIERYAKDFGFASQQEFTHDIKGKRVADIGSGLGGFALDVILHDLDTEVISVNPARSSPKFNQYRKEFLRENRELFYQYKMRDIKKALKKVDKNTVIAFAHDLSAIPDNSVDEALDTLAVFHYSNPKYREIYEQSIGEMLRIVKPEGKVLISDYKGQNPWYRNLFDELGLDYIIREAGGRAVFEVAKH